MKKFLIPVFALLLIVAGCARLPEIKQERLIANRNWQKFDTLRFTVEGKANEAPRDLNLIIRFNSMFTPKVLPVSILLLTPDGAESVIEKKIWVRNPDETPRGIRHGEASWDYTFCFREAYEFNRPGTYRILIDNETGKFDNNGIEVITLEAVPASERKKEEKTD